MFRDVYVACWWRHMTRRGIVSFIVCNSHFCVRIRHHSLGVPMLPIHFTSQISADSRSTVRLSKRVLAWSSAVDSDIPWLTFFSFFQDDTLPGVQLKRYPVPMNDGWSFTSLQLWYRRSVFFSDGVQSTFNRSTVLPLLTLLFVIVTAIFQFIFAHFPCESLSCSVSPVYRQRRKAGSSLIDSCQLLIQWNFLQNKLSWLDVYKSVQYQYVSHLRHCKKEKRWKLEKRPTKWRQQSKIVRSRASSALPTNQVGYQKVVSWFAAN